MIFECIIKVEILISSIIKPIIIKENKLSLIYDNEKKCYFCKVLSTVRKL